MGIRICGWTETEMPSVDPVDSQKEKSTLGIGLLRKCHLYVFSCSYVIFVTKPKTKREDRSILVDQPRNRQRLIYQTLLDKEEGRISSPSLVIKTFPSNVGHILFCSIQEKDYNSVQFTYEDFLFSTTTSFYHDIFDLGCCLHSYNSRYQRLAIEYSVSGTAASWVSRLAPYYANISTGKPR